MPTVNVGPLSIKPRGRIHVDVGDLSGPLGAGTRLDGRDIEIRRMRFGIDAELGESVDLRFDADFGGNVVEIVDAYARVDLGSGLTVTAGQHNMAQSLEELTSSNDISFLERAAFTDAFGFERRLGVSAEYQRGALVLQGGVSRENLLTINDGTPNAVGWNARAVLAPRVGTTQLHVGVHANGRDFGDGGRSLRYRQRAFIHTVDTRFAATPSLAANAESGWGGEAALLSGRFHAQAEVHWQTVDRVGAAADPTFFGGAAEVGVFLTNDARGYRGGVFRGPRVRRAMSAGGLGALQLVARYDRLDLNDAGVLGGVQDGYMAGLNWWPENQVRVMLGYARLEYRQSPIVINGSRSFALDALGARFQLSF